MHQREHNNPNINQIFSYDSFHILNAVIEKINATVIIQFIK